MNVSFLLARSFGDHCFAPMPYDRHLRRRVLVREEAVGFFNTHKFLGHNEADFQGESWLIISAMFKYLGVTLGGSQFSVSPSRVTLKEPEDAVLVLSTRTGPHRFETKAGEDFTTEEIHASSFEFSLWYVEEEDAVLDFVRDAQVSGFFLS